MKESEHQGLAIEMATDLIHAVTLNTNKPFILEEGDHVVGEIRQPSVLQRLQFIGIYAKRRELEAIGEEQMASDIINKGRKVLLNGN